MLDKINTTANRGRHFFAGKLLNARAKAIKEEQLQVVRDHGLFESGELEKKMKGHFNVDVQTASASMTLSYVTYTRFLDMKDVRRKRYSYHLYNRIIFGHLYGALLGELLFGYTDDVKAEVEKELLDSMNTQDFTYNGKKSN